VERIQMSFLKRRIYSVIAYIERALPTKVIFLYRRTVAHNKVIAYLTKKRFRAANKMDRYMSLHLPKRSGYFVEVGGYDGLIQSNSKYFELFRNYTGILIEPNPKSFELAKLNRTKNTICIQAACVSNSFQNSFVDFIGGGW